MLASVLGQASQALAGPPFFVDDPGTVTEGRAQFFVRYEFVRDHGQNTDSLPAATLMVGLPEKLELTIDEAYLRPESSNSPSAGLRDFGLALKWRFLEQDGVVPAVALDYSLSLATANRGLSAGTIVHSPYVTAGWRLDDQWQVFGNVGANLPDDSVQRPQLFAGVALGCMVAESWLVGVEVLDNTRVSDAQRSDLSVGLATQLDLSESWSLMARVGRSVSGTQGINTFFGFQVSF